MAKQDINIDVNVTGAQNAIQQLQSVKNVGIDSATHFKILNTAFDDTGKKLDNVSKGASNTKSGLNALGEGAKGLTGILVVLAKVFGLNNEEVKTLMETHAGLREAMRGTNELMRSSNELVGENTTITEAQTVAKEENVAATEAQTVANEELGASMLDTLGPIGLVVGAIGALAFGIYEYITAQELKKEADKADKEELKEILKVDKEILDIDNKIAILKGTLTEAELSNNEALAKGVHLQLLAADTRKKDYEALKGLQSTAPIKPIGPDINDSYAHYHTQLEQYQTYLTLKKQADDRYQKAYNDGYKLYSDTVDYNRLKNNKENEKENEKLLDDTDETLAKLQEEIDLSNAKKITNLISQYKKEQSIKEEFDIAEEQRRIKKEEQSIKESTSLTGDQKKAYIVQLETDESEIIKKIKEKFAVETNNGILEIEKKEQEESLKKYKDYLSKLSEAFTKYQKDKFDKEQEQQKASDRLYQTMYQNQLQQPIEEAKANEASNPSESNQVKVQQAIYYKITQDTMNYYSGLIEEAKKNGVDTVELQREYDNQMQIDSENNQKALTDIQKKGDDQRIKNTIDALNQVSQSIISAEEEQSKAVQEANNYRIQQTQTEMQAQEALAEAGLKNNLAFEERRNSELEKQQIQESIRQKKLKEASIFFNAVESFTDNSKNPIASIGQALALLAGVNAASAHFAEEGGVIGEITERSTLNRRHKGGGDVLLHAQTGEGILNRKEMYNLGGSKGFKELKKMLNVPYYDNLTAPIAPIVVNDNSAVVKELNDLKRALMNKKEMTIDWDKIGQMQVTEKENGRIIKTKYKKGRQ